MRQALAFVATLVVLAGCGGGAPSLSVAPGGPGGRTTPPSSAAAGQSGQPGFSFGTVAGVTDLAHSAGLLVPADFAAVGLAGAGTPTENPSGNANYIVYKGLSGAGGGIELDIFMYATPAEAATEFGGTSMYAMDDAAVQQIGADQAGYYPDQPGNDPGVTYDEIRVLAGKGWFDLSVPSGPQAEAQLQALAALVVARGAALFG